MIVIPNNCITFALAYNTVVCLLTRAMRVNLLATSLTANNSRGKRYTFWIESYNDCL